VDKLTQSVLAKAFAGALVPTEAELAEHEDRSFESAEELLARIQHYRGSDSTPKKSAKLPSQKQGATGCHTAISPGFERI
jgi:hypothetical protein